MSSLLVLACTPTLNPRCSCTSAFSCKPSKGHARPCSTSTVEASPSFCLHLELSHLFWIACFAIRALCEEGSVTKAQGAKIKGVFDITTILIYMVLQCNSDGQVLAAFTVALLVGRDSCYR